MCEIDCSGESGEMKSKKERKTANDSAPKDKMRHKSIYNSMQSNRIVCVMEFATQQTMQQSKLMFSRMNEWPSLGSNRRHSKWKILSSSQKSWPSERNVLLPSIQCKISNFFCGINPMNDLF